MTILFLCIQQLFTTNHLWAHSLADSKYISRSKGMQVIPNSWTPWLSRLHNSTHSQMHTFGTGTRCPSKSDFCLLESKTMGVKKGRDQLKVCVLVRCSSYRRVHWERINCTIHTYNLLIQWNLDITNSQGTRKICLLLQGFIISKFFLIITRSRENHSLFNQGLRYIEVCYVKVPLN